jgi:poly(3-hydroxybutyrate) depolymerase
MPDREQSGAEMASRWRVTLAALVACAAVFGAHRISRAEIRPAAVPTSAELAAAGFQEIVLRHDGLDRRFLVLAPQGGAKPSAIVVLLHGGSQSMRKLFGPNAGATRAWPTLARAENVLLLTTGDPDGDWQAWTDLRSGPGVKTTKADDVGFLLAMLDWAKARYPTAPTRAYVTGASNGGMMSYRLLIEAPERFAAAASFVASMPADLAGLKRPARPVPLLIANGTLDPAIAARSPPSKRASRGGSKLMAQPPARPRRRSSPTPIRTTAAASSDGITRQGAAARR